MHTQYSIQYNTMQYTNSPLLQEGQQSAAGDVHSAQMSDRARQEHELDEDEVFRV